MANESSTVKSNSRLIHSFECLKQDFNYHNIIDSEIFERYMALLYRDIGTLDRLIILFNTYLCGDCHAYWCLNNEFLNV